MKIPMKGQPRAHHYLPQCWFAGFTESGHKNDRLWVTDLKRNGQWPSSPPNAGHARDFYRIDEPNVDPVTAERFYGSIEDRIAPLLKALNYEKRGPTKSEMESICVFMALQWSRVLAYRPMMLSIADKAHQDNMTKALSSKTSWRKTLKKLRFPLDDPATDYEKMREFVENKQYSLTAENEFYVTQALKSACQVGPYLMERYWETYINHKGSFIACDSPVVLDGEEKQMVGFKNAGIVAFPISRHVLMHGTLIRMRRLRLTEMLIGRFNTLMMLHAHEQVFSWKPDFCFLDHTEGYQTDWRLFAKDKF